MDYGDKKYWYRDVTNTTQKDEEGNFIKGSNVLKIGLTLPCSIFKYYRNRNFSEELMLFILLTAELYRQSLPLRVTLGFTPENPKNV